MLTSSTIFFIKLLGRLTLRLAYGLVSEASFFSELQRQIELEQIVSLDRIHLGDVLIAAAGAEFVVDPTGITVTERSDDIVGKAIGQRGVDAFEVRAAFEEVRVQKVGIERVLFDVLPISPE